MNITSSSAMATTSQKRTPSTRAVWVIGHLPMRGQPDHPRAGAGPVSEPSPGILGSQRYARPRGPLPPFTSALPSISRKAGQLRDGRPDYCLLNTNQYRAFSEDRPGCGPQFVAPVNGLLITADASFKRINWRKRALQSVVAAVCALQLNAPDR